MENRRQHYRHEFAPTRRFVVRLQATEGATSLEADVINLSTSGFCVYAPGLRSTSADNWVATIALSSDGAVSIPVERVYAREGNQDRCGFRFVSADPEVDEEREKAIWRFLLQEQRRRWQLQRGA